MSRLQQELQRLYLPQPGGPAGVRALVIEAALPAGWNELAPLWQGVQSDLGLPAPAIAVSGSDALQLWFSLAQPVPPDAARALLEGLRQRWLAGIPPERIRLRLGAEPAAMPPKAVGPERWAAFIAPDLAPLFAGEPWLDHPSGADAQADLLAQFAPIAADALERVLAQLAGAAAAPAPATVTPISAAAAGSAGAALDPRSFLLAVMRDPAVDLRLRIEAAKVLLDAD